MSAKYAYVCIKTTCGHVEYTNFAPLSAKKCPECGGMMKREKAD